MNEFRISRPQMFMEIAHTVAKRSTCMRLNVGAVIVKERRIVSIGYNGVPAGEPHCRGNHCPGKLSCNLTTHAEANAIQFLPEGIGYGLDLYVTDSPCSNCFDLINQDHRFDRLFFSTPYRITDHLEKNLFDRGLEVYRIVPAGYIMDWHTKELVDVET